MDRTTHHSDTHAPAASQRAGAGPTPAGPPPLPALGDYPPISDYAAIGDCRTVALVSRDGAVEWLCLPHFSASAVFAALLDRHRGGRFVVRPTGPYRSTRRYLERTNVLETTFTTDTGVATVTDCMPILAGSALERVVQPERELLRRIEGVSGEVELTVCWEPRPDYARAPGRLRRRGALGWACTHRNEIHLLHSDVPLALDANHAAVAGTVTVGAGERSFLSHCYTKSDMAVVAPLGRHAQARLAATVRWWRAWSADCDYEGPYREAVVRSALTLKLLSYAPSGAVVAAPTASLPEHVGGVRNWDYRYCWLRDAALTTSAFLDLGFTAEGDAFLDWLLHATQLTRPRLQVMYDVYGRTRLTERILEHFEGYRGSTPVRVGNGAAHQLQLDVYGEVALAAREFSRRGGHLDRYEQRLLRGIGHAICELWREPDAGIWEVRGEPRHHTHSRFMCWAGLDSLLRLHDDGVLALPVRRFRHEREALRSAIEAHGFNRTHNSYVATFGGDTPDAALLLMPCFGYIRADHPRMQGTFAYVEGLLGRDGLLHRYPAGFDGFPEGEGAFGLCSFWAADLLARQGRVDEARASLEHLLGFGNDVGLFSEEIDVASGAALGNFPQAFTHVGVINAAISISNALAQRGEGRGTGVDAPHRRSGRVNEEAS